jgi:hypothetical protein
LAARDRERTKEQVAADKRREAEAAKAARREASKLKNARGGFSGVASGPFSLGSSKEGKQVRLAMVICTDLHDRQEEQLKSRLLWLRIWIWLSSRARQERGRQLRRVWFPVRRRWRWRKRRRVIDQERRWWACVI